ncbi:metallophosphoesterase [uncultured Veillonella sp.]|uniref:metallophosphoesterase n=1 Tax=uncultured Veillonella sp. TaxID=159268 RepID=UPI0028DC8E5C|nr:metallophosphoesterase [uncultured Veillonella sp.]
MKVFAIGDLHLSGNPPTKPMDIFGPHWDNHWARIKEYWANHVTDDDIVFLVGDMSWALRLDEAACDLQEIASMTGKKYMIRGNHDYWWSSANKMRNLMGDAITFLQGHGTAELIQTEEGPRIIAFGGTRAYLCPGDSHFSPETDQSIYERELMRTEAALQEMDRAVESLLEKLTAERNMESTGSEVTDNTIGSEKTETLTIDIHNIPVTKLLLLHYPPFNESNAPSGFTDLMDTYNVDMCIFGHLHDQISFKRIPKEFGTTKLELVSADYLNFTLKEIM